MQLLGSIVVSIPACHAGDRGSIPRRGDFFLLFFSLPPPLNYIYLELAKTSGGNSFGCHVYPFQVERGRELELSRKLYSFTRPDCSLGQSKPCLTTNPAKQ